MRRGRLKRGCVQQDSAAEPLRVDTFTQVLHDATSIRTGNFGPFVRETWQTTANPKIQMIQGRGFGAYHDFSGLWTRIGVLRQQLDRFVNRFALTLNHYRSHNSECKSFFFGIRLQQRTSQRDEKERFHAPIPSCCHFWSSPATTDVAHRRHGSHSIPEHGPGWDQPHPERQTKSKRYVSSKSCGGCSP